MGYYTHIIAFQRNGNYLSHLQCSEWTLCRRRFLLHSMQAQIPRTKQKNCNRMHATCAPYINNVTGCSTFSSQASTFFAVSRVRLFFFFVLVKCQQQVGKLQAYLYTLYFSMTIRWGGWVITPTFCHFLIRSQLEYGHIRTLDTRSYWRICSP